MACYQTLYVDNTNYIEVTSAVPFMKKQNWTFFLFPQNIQIKQSHKIEDGLKLYKFWVIDQSIK